jgi:hypothetical protein
LNGPRWAAAAGLLSVLLSGAVGCASRPVRRNFPPAGAEQAARALDAWRRAVERADALPPSRILYEAKIRQGIGSASGTLAISTAPPVRGTLAGSFGAPIATYADGVLAGEKLAPVEIEPGPLLALLSGVWREPGPHVRGVLGDEAQLAWETPMRAEGVIRLADARFVSLHVERRGRAFEAEYAGAAEPWPERVTLTDVASGSTLRLVLQAKEPIR